MIITPLDFETANCSDASICAVGIAVFERGDLIEKTGIQLHHLPAGEWSTPTNSSLETATPNI